MVDLRTLTLARCNNSCLIRTLNPDETHSGVVLCPKLEEIILYVSRTDWFHSKDLFRMAEGRAARHAKLQAITIISLGGAFLPTGEVLRLRKHVWRVKYMITMRRLRGTPSTSRQRRRRCENGS